MAMNTRIFVIVSFVISLGALILHVGRFFFGGLTGSGVLRSQDMVIYLILMVLFSLILMLHVHRSTPHKYTIEWTYFLFATVVISMASRFLFLMWG